MKKNILIMTLFFALLIFHSCKKENQINKSMEGTWVFTEYKRAGGYVKSDFSQDRMSFEFTKYKKAYTQTMKGVFIVDFADLTKVDIRETFYYELKNDEFVVSKVDVGFKNEKLLKYRFKVQEYKNDKLKLVRLDSTDLYIKATKQ